MKVKPVIMVGGSGKRLWSLYNGVKTLDKKIGLLVNKLGKRK